MLIHFPASLSFDEAKLSAICRKWKIAELSLFGSALRDDFGPDHVIPHLALGAILCKT